MTLRVFNTLTRQVEEFRPIAPGRVSMYTCGPTVWNYAHIGNFRTFLFEDLLRRWLEASDLEVFQIMNLTDVDDRIIKEAGKKGISIRDFVAPYAEAFHEDRKYLRIKDASVYPRATEFVPQMIELVERLLQNGTAYKGEDGSVYFAISKFPAYGRLSQLDRRELKSGASGRVSSDEYAKEDARDFALWKAADPADEAVGAAWDAPFGRGRPGWHLECSAMALALLKEKSGGDVLDIHAGGVDLIFPHHEDEIAQSCAFTGRPDFARYWLHGEFLNVRGTKMSKRFGNITTPRDLKADGVDAGAIRLLMFQTHYRQKMDLTDESLEGAREGSRRLGEFDIRLRGNASNRVSSPLGGGDWDRWANNLERGVRESLDEDLDAPVAIRFLFAAAREGNRFLDEGHVPLVETHLGTWNRVIGVFDLLPSGQTISGVGSVTLPGPQLHGVGEVLNPDPPADPAAVDVWAQGWAKARLVAKSRKDYKEADRIRDLLESHGFEIRDNKDGSVEVRRSST